MSVRDGTFLLIMTIGVKASQSSASLLDILKSTLLENTVI
jgi:hypothetical protein